MAAIAAIKNADKVILRSKFLAGAEEVKKYKADFETFDDLYESSRTYEALTDKIVRALKKQSKGINLCYCVDGSASEDRAAMRIRRECKEVVLVEGVSYGASAAAKAGLCCAYQSVSVFDAFHVKLTLPLVVYNVLGQDRAADLKLLLTEKFGDEAPAAYVCGNEVLRMPLYEIDRQSRYAAETAIVVYDAPLLERKRFDLDDLMEILRRLRAPDGCPWDRVQTHGSIRINAIEEAYELVDAIDCDDPDKMREEAGDVVMQAAFHALIEEERGNFDMTDVITEVCEKLITRHTHVFGQDKAADDKGALTVWEKNKMTEKGQKTFSDAVNDVPQCFPALLRAQKICKRMAKGGWNFSSFDANEAKLREEVAELRAAYESGDRDKIAEELGDVLMVAAHLGRLVGADCEQALLDTVKKNAARYTEWERLVLADGKDVHKLSEEEWVAYYKQAKKNVSSR